MSPAAPPVDARFMRYTERRDAVLRALAAAHGAAKQRFLAASEHCRRTLGRMIANRIVVRHPQHVIALPGTDRPTIIARRLGGLISLDRKSVV